LEGTVKRSVDGPQNIRSSVKTQEVRKTLTNLANHDSQKDEILIMRGSGGSVRGEVESSCGAIPGSFHLLMLGAGGA
jgi:hypothetical protein